MVQHVNSRVVAAAALSTEPSEHCSSFRAEQQRRPAFKRFRSVTLRNNVFPAAVAIQLTFIVVLLISHMKGNKAGFNQSQIFGNDAHQKVKVSKQTQPDPTFEDEPRPFLPEPMECSEWRSVSTDRAKLRVYYKHFTSHDKTDWFLYVSIFDEAFQERMRREGRTPRYLDVGTSWARRWSNTYFFDRCQGWKGVCIEHNPIYQDELESQRTCKYIPKCISDIPREVLFAFGEAYGGVVKNGTETQNLGVDLDRLVVKKAEHFSGTEKVVCSTLSQELPGKQHFDLMSLDVDGFELLALKGVDWKRTTIDVIVVETKSQAVKKLLRAVGYDKHVVLNNQLFIRRGSKLRVNQKYAKWIPHFDNQTGAVLLH